MSDEAKNVPPRPPSSSSVNGLKLSISNFVKAMIMMSPRVTSLSTVNTMLNVFDSSIPLVYIIFKRAKKTTEIIEHFSIPNTLMPSIH